MKALLSFIEENGEPVAVIEILDDALFSLYKERQRLPSDASLQADFGGMSLKEYMDKEVARVLFNIQSRFDREMARQLKAAEDRPAALVKVEELNKTLAGEKTPDELATQIADIAAVVAARNPNPNPSS